MFALSAHNSSCGETAGKIEFERNLERISDYDRHRPAYTWIFHAQDALTAAASNNAGTIIWQIVLQIVLIALNAVFACAEIAVLSVSDAKLASLAESGNKRAKRLAKLTKQPARFLATIQVAITLAGFLASAFAAENFAQYIKQLIPNIPESLCIIVITILLSYVTLVFGELVPKRVAMKKSESLALSISGLLNFVSTILLRLSGCLRFQQTESCGLCISILTATMKRSRKKKSA